MYCINCSLNELPALRVAKCKYIRWGSFPWEEQYSLTSDSKGLDKVYEKQNEFVRQMKLNLGNDSCETRKKVIEIAVALGGYFDKRCIGVLNN